MNADKQMTSVNTAFEGIEKKIEQRAQQSIDNIEKKLGERVDGAFDVVDQYTESVGRKLLDFENQFRQVSNFPSASQGQQGSDGGNKTG